MKNFRFLDELKAQERVFVACSGGLDSTVLLDYLHREKVPVHALHCNFQLRGADSDADEAFIMAFCIHRKIPFDFERFDIQSLKKNSQQSIQQIARNLRYSWFENILSKNSNSLLCTAHHLDDHEEQVWMRILASGRILDLGGILAQRDAVRRPLISLSKEEIYVYAKVHNLTWREDTSNNETFYTRNKIRHNLKPVLNSIDPRNRSAALKLADEVQQIRTACTQILERNFGKDLYYKAFFVSNEFWENQLYLMKELLLESWRGSNAQLQEVERFYQYAQIGSCLELSNGFYIILEKDGLWFGQKQTEIFVPIQIDWMEPKVLAHYEVTHRKSTKADFLHTINSDDTIFIKKIISAKVLHLPNGKVRKLKKLFNEQKWKHVDRRNALGWYLNNNLIGVINPTDTSTWNLTINTADILVEIIKKSK